MDPLSEIFLQNVLPFATPKLTAQIVYSNSLLFENVNPQPHSGDSFKNQRIAFQVNSGKSCYRFSWVLTVCYIYFARIKMANETIRIQINIVFTICQLAHIVTRSLHIWSGHALGEQIGPSLSCWLLKTKIK